MWKVEREREKKRERKRFGGSSIAGSFGSLVLGRGQGRSLCRCEHWRLSLRNEGFDEESSRQQRAIEKHILHTISGNQEKNDGIVSLDSSSELTSDTRKRKVKESIVEQARLKE